MMSNIRALLILKDVCKIIMKGGREFPFVAPVIPFYFNMLTDILRSFTE